MCADTLSEWRKIEAEANEQVRAELEAAEGAPLPYGANVAWAEVSAVSRMGQTDGLSRVHRALSGDMALCGEQIPPPVLRLPMPLTVDLIGALRRCKYCEAAYMGKENVA